MNNSRISIKDFERNDQLELFIGQRLPVNPLGLYEIGDTH